jgi:hypothetical protein
MAGAGPGIIVFLVALFFAAIGATLFAVAMRRGGGANERRDDEH